MNYLNVEWKLVLFKRYHLLFLLQFNCNLYISAHFSEKKSDFSIFFHIMPFYFFNIVEFIPEYKRQIEDEEFYEPGSCEWKKIGNDLVSKNFSYWILINVLTTLLFFFLLISNFFGQHLQSVQNETDW